MFLGSLVVFRVKKVLAKLHGVALHVKESERIGQLGANRMRFAVWIVAECILVKPGMPCERLLIVAAEIKRGGACAAGVFPLRLGRQSIAAS